MSNVNDLLKRVLLDGEFFLKMWQGGKAPNAGPSTSSHFKEARRYLDSLKPCGECWACRHPEYSESCREKAVVA